MKTKKSKMKKRKAQAWFPDFIIGVLVFSTAAILFFNFFVAKQESLFQRTPAPAEEARAISNILMTGGYPSGWSASNVSYIGLSNDDFYINATKVAEFAAIDYKKSQTLFGISYDFMVRFLDSQGNSFSVGGINSVGKPGYNLSMVTDEGDSIAKITRIMIYRNGNVSEIMQLELFVWD